MTEPKESAENKKEPHDAAWKKILRFGVFLAGLIFMVSYLDSVFQYKEAPKRFRLFFEDKEAEYDVMFFGTSHVIDSVSPLELWDNHGITSYNFAGYGMNMPTLYWLIQNVLEYKTPKLVVIDCSRISKTNLYGTVYQTHNVFDAFPLTKTKADAIFELFEPEYQLEFFWKFSIYHERWEELEEDDFDTQYSYERGYSHRYPVAVPKEFVPIASSSQTKETANGVIYLRKAIEFCQEKGIDVMLTYMPYPAAATQQREANRAAVIAEEYGINYVNFLTLDGVVNYNTDLFDSSHLNVSGAHKITDFLGNYFRWNYNFPDHTGEEIYASWDEDYQKHVAVARSKIKSLKSLDSYLMMLSDKNFSSCIYIPKSSMLLSDARMLELVSNIPVSEYPERLEEAIALGGDYFLFVDNENGRLLECIGASASGKAEISSAAVSYGSAGEDGHLIEIGTSKYLVGSESSAADIEIIVIDHKSGEIFDTGSFTVTLGSQYVEASRAGSVSTPKEETDP